MKLVWKVWLHGLLAAVIGGGATALVTGFAVPDLVTRPDWMTVLGKIFLVSGVISAAGYLKNSPVPALREASDTEFYRKHGRYPGNTTLVLAGLLHYALLGGAGLCLVMFLAGCSTFSTTQTDNSYEEGKKVRTITTKAKARTFFDGRSALANFKASQTDKTQSAVVGSLNNESSGTNSLEALRELRRIAEALPK